MTKKFIIIIIFIGFILYANSLGNALFWDDDENIVKNVYIKDFHYLPQIFTTNQIAGAGQISNQYRPLLLLTYSIEYHLAGLWPTIYHFDNLLLHIANSILVFYLIKKLVLLTYRTEKKENFDSFEQIGFFRQFFLSSGKRGETAAMAEGSPAVPEVRKTRKSPPLREMLKFPFIIPFLTSLLFLIHPVQTEAVDYVAGRTDLLSTFFILLGLYLFIKGTKWWILSLLYIAAILSKETAIVFPILLIIVSSIKDSSLRGTPLSGATSAKSKVVTGPAANNLLIHLSLWTITLIYIILRLTIFNFQNTLNFYGAANIYTSHILYRIYTFLSTIPIYIGLIFYPKDLFAERFISVYTSLFYPLPLLGLLIVLFLGLLAILFWKRNPLISFAILWIFTNMILSTNILIPVNAMMAEHWLYSPSVGIFILLSVLILYLLFEIKTNKRERFDNFEQIGFLRKFFLLSGKRGETAAIAEGSPGLPEVRKTSKNPPLREMAKFSLFLIIIFALSARTILRNRDWHDPITFYEQTLSFSPKSARVHNNLAMAYAENGDHGQAIVHYNSAISISDIYPQTHHNLANSYKALGNTDKAIIEYEKAIQMAPNFIYSYRPLFDLLNKTGKKEEAQKYLDTFQKLFPNYHLY